jgi:hypothetical protein
MVPARSDANNLSRFAAIAGLSLTAMIGFAGGAAAQDRVVLVTGVALEGEIKSASRGTLSFDNDELDVVKVDLVDVAELTSPSFFEVSDDIGTIYYGSLEAADSGTVVVSGTGASVTLDLARIVEIIAFDNNFWGRTNGFLDIGASVAKANSLSSFTIGALAAYRGPRWGLRLSADGYWQRQKTIGELGGELIETTNRQSFSSSISRYLQRWAIQGSADWETNRELELDLRFQAGVQGIYSLIENQSLELRAGAGLVNNTEDYIGEKVQTTAEVIAGAALDIFDAGAVDVYTSLTTYTNLSERGRFRVALDGRVSWEVIDDFFIGLTVKENLDNRPPVETGAKRDFRYGFTVGWSWS